MPNSASIQQKLNDLKRKFDRTKDQLNVKERNLPRFEQKLEQAQGDFNKVSQEVNDLKLRANEEERQVLEMERELRSALDKEAEERAKKMG